MLERSWFFPDGINNPVDFSRDLLDAFSSFPSNTALNCDEYYSILSLICSDIPYSFIVFVCECADPTISSGRLLSHRVEVGNFLLVLPCCVIYPRFHHQFLAEFKTNDTTKSGYINRDLMLRIMGSVLDDQSCEPAPDLLLMDEYRRRTETDSVVSFLSYFFILWEVDTNLAASRPKRE